MKTENLLTKLDDRVIPDALHEIRAVVTVRNEVTRLPFLLNHYRGLGVARFLFADDGSTDGTTEFLLTQPDCHVFRPSNSYSESAWGTLWQNALLDDYGTRHWTLTIDADELFIYPHCEKIKLPEFCAWLDREGSTALYAFMLDMYPDTDLSKAVCESGKPFYKICPYFDTDYKFVSRAQFLTNPALRFPPEEVIGGPRMRKFYASQKCTSFLNQFAHRLIWKAVNLLERIGINVPDKPHKAPTLFKVPLIKWQKGDARLTGHHIAAPKHGKFSAITGVFLHFKFFADFHNKAKTEAGRGEHFSGAQEYKRYLRHIAKDPNITFMYEGSRRYENSDSVLKAGLMRTTPEFENQVK